MDKDFKPVFFKPRLVLLAWKSKIESNLRELIGKDILEPISSAEWGTPLVPILKPNGEIRICGDYKVTINRHLSDFNSPLTRIDKIFASLQGGELFSKLDLLGLTKNKERTESILKPPISRNLFELRALMGMKIHSAETKRNNKYLEKSRVSRTCAVGGFFLSIPIFLTGIILYTFNNFHSTPAVISSVLIGTGIIFCGGAMVHNVFVWQKEKTLCYRNQQINLSLISHIGPNTPPIQFMNHMSHANQFHQANLQLHQTTSLTPVSPNHSQNSFNALGSGPVSSSYLMRPSTATPPTPKTIANGCLTLTGREASGSASPSIPPTLDISTITSTSLHELSTLV
ncbi:uncharacterized protein LOC119688701 [Teleopsis dalmanni]|uniref:uncharacterized protein LOC119688701 n=1 Tax=Teleopsis dalmanni TaxID=139649 RepID=UPI0018CFB754|nr:uncharacterized protein LOC119688701 [Teleopsis dalmanni]